MKAQRRHDLQTNSLARALSQSPVFFRKHGAKVFLAIVVIGLAIILIRQRMSLAEQEVNVGWGNITIARDAIGQLAQTPAFRLDGENEFSLRSRLTNDASRAVRTAVSADDRALASEGLVVQGDLNWTLANLPEIVGAATRPALKSQVAAADYLSRAEDSYARVLKSYADFPLAAASARFGLAACAENRGQWDQAAEQYQAIIKDPALALSFKPQAEFRLKHISQVKEPLYLALIPEATQPATASAMGPSPAPAVTTPVQPATRK